MKTYFLGVDLSNLKLESIGEVISASEQWREPYQ